MKSDEIFLTKLVLYNLANLYYDRTHLFWNRLKEKALFLSKHSNLGPKGTKEFSAYLYDIYISIYEKYQENPALFEQKSLLNVEEGNLLICKDIAKKSVKMRKSIKDKTSIHNYILSWKKELITQMTSLKEQNEIDKSIKTELLKQWENLEKVDAPFYEDIFRISKTIYFLLIKNEKKRVYSKKEKMYKNKQKVAMINELVFGNADEEANKVKIEAEELINTLERNKKNFTDNQKQNLGQLVFELNGFYLTNDWENVKKKISEIESIVLDETLKR